MAEEPVVPGGWVTFRYAALADKFHLAPLGLAGLTDYQIDAVLFHPRNKEGGLVEPLGPEPPPAPVTPEARLRTIAQLEAEHLITPQQAAALREQVRTHEPRRHP
ncbi:MAG TPA: hypothetical protein VGE74_26045 [Gemmata sp.]